MKQKMLYVTINDGSDTRINKEIKSLYPYFDIDYIGIGKQLDKAFIQEYCNTFNVIKGYHFNKWDLIKYYWLFLKLFFTKKYHTIHVINEQNYMLFLPFLMFHRHVVLDIFDSIFLIRKMNNWTLKLRDFIYKKVRNIIVTDYNRKSLMEESFHHKIDVIGNYPYARVKPVLENKTNLLKIFYYGTLNEERGTKMLQALIDTYKDVKVIMAGWISDDNARKMTEHNQVEFIGTVTQEKALDIASECDYLMCVYEPNNINNINASPNKIYDAIQVETPVIINGEVKVSQFVSDNELGIVIPDFYNINSTTFYERLKNNKDKFTFSDELKEKYTWENEEKTLLRLHQS